MKTLEGYTLIYDEACPLCNAYTGYFVKTGMLDKEGRQAYCRTSCAVHENLDIDRARNEIALVDRSSGQVTYGVNSLIKVIQHSFPFFTPVFNNGLFQKLAKTAYSLVSYNRKAIVPGNRFEGDDHCSPDLNVKYRWLYVALSWVFVSVVLTTFSQLLTGIIPESNYLREGAICGGQIVFQSAVLYLIRKDRIIYYLGNMMTVSVIGSLALLPLLLIDQFVIIEPYLALGWFMLVVGGMLLEHFRRCRILGLDWRMSASWVAYRILIVVLLF